MASNTIAASPIALSSTPSAQAIFISLSSILTFVFLVWLWQRFKVVAPLVRETRNYIVAAKFDKGSPVGATELQSYLLVVTLYTIFPERLKNRETRLHQTFHTPRSDRKSSYGSSSHFYEFDKPKHHLSTLSWPLPQGSSILLEVFYLNHADGPFPWQRTPRSNTHSEDADKMDISQLNSSVLDHTPSLTPPPGVVPNFINPPTRKLPFRVATYVTMPIMVIFLVLRLYTRARVTRKFGADDILAVASAICIGAYTGSILWMLEGPLGIHTWDVPVSHLKAAFLKTNLASQCLYDLASIFVKVALLVLYLRIFNPNDRARIMVWAGIIFIVPFYVACAIAQTKEYVPPKNDPDGWTSPRPASMYTALLNISAVQGFIGILTDFYILFVPMHFVLGLRLPLGKKIGVSAIFMTGLAGCICSIIGTVYRFEQRTSGDTLWTTIPAYAVGIVELNIGIMCNCMPVIFVLFKGMAKKEHYIAPIRYFRSLTRTRRSKAGTEKGQDPQQLALPAVPKPTLTGLRSFIRKVHRSQAQTTEVASYGELTSMNSTNDDYHTQLKTVR